MWGSAPGLLALLTEQNHNFQIKGIEELEQIVTSEWPQIADQLSTILKLSNNPTFPAHEKASRLASKVYYYLGRLDDAVQYAIKSGSTFDITINDEYTKSVSNHCIATYIKEINNPNKNPALTTIVQNVLQLLIQNQRYSSCLALAIETKMLEYVELCLRKNNHLVEKAIDVVNYTVLDSKYKLEVLGLFKEFATKFCDEFQQSKLFLSLNDSNGVASILNMLRGSTSTDDWLMAYQIAFELAENANQKFRAEVIECLSSEMADLKSIIRRKTLLTLYLDFLFKNNHTDIHIIVALKETLRTSKMIIHSSVVCAYGFMFAGTGDDNFYRNNITWFTNSKKWAQFNTIAAMGAIHIGHLSSALNVLGPFLSGNIPSYALGGGLYALGLIYANYKWDDDILKIVKENVTVSKHPVVRHGACLALGLIAMGTRNSLYANTVHNVILENIPEPGEAAGYAYGMIMLGVGLHKSIPQLLEFASTNEHEKIVRGLSMCFALMVYGCRDSAEPLIAQLMESKKSVLRESAAWSTALAYVGTAANVALQRLLHLAVSDVNPDVRRAAVIGVGFVLSRSPKDVPVMLDLLAKSYHPHVRSGAALAVGIACAGTGMPEAVQILQPLLEDPEDFVMQSAMIAMAMVLQQQSDSEVPYSRTFRAYLRKKITKDRNELQAFGVCLAYGILNAGGRNVALSCNTLRGENSILATVGLALFCNYFYWQPLALMLPLAFHPTGIIGLDKNLEIVRWSFFCNAPESKFAYPPSFQSEAVVAKKKKAVTLSITPKGIDEEERENGEDEEDAKVNEKPYYTIENRSRVTLRQLEYIDFGLEDRYTPVTGKPSLGFVMLKENEIEEDDDEEDLDY